MNDICTPRSIKTRVIRKGQINEVKIMEICLKYRNGCNSIPNFEPVRSYEKKSSHWYAYVSCDCSIKHCGWCPVQEVRRGRVGYDNHFPTPLTGKVAAYW